MKKRLLTLVLALVLVLSLSICFVACDNTQTGDVKIRISTTTSVNDSGLMEYLTPYFEADNQGYKLEISSAGTGAAINSAKYGNADLILVHSKSQEDAFVAENYARIVGNFAAERISFMYNYFVIVGPTTEPATEPQTDPAGVLNCEDASEAFAAIASSQSEFISRGDNSGTHTKEVSLWPTELGITKDTDTLPSGVTSWYTSAGQGMGACLTMANENNAYVLTDKATFLSYKNDPTGDKLPNLTLLMENSANLQNTYSMIAVDNDAPFISSTTGEALPAGTVSINEAAADIFINWMNGEHASALINFYGTSSYGAPLFYLMG